MVGVMKQHRRCRAKEFGFHLEGCKGYIDNANYYFCSYCHKVLTKTSDPDGLTYHDEGTNKPSQMPILAGERIGRGNKILLGKGI